MVGYYTYSSYDSLNCETFKVPHHLLAAAASLLPFFRRGQFAVEEFGGDAELGK